MNIKILIDKEYIEQITREYEMSVRTEVITYMTLKTIKTFCEVQSAHSYRKDNADKEQEIKETLNSHYEDIEEKFGNVDKIVFPVKKYKKNILEI